MTSTKKRISDKIATNAALNTLVANSVLTNEQAERMFYAAFGNVLEMRIGRMENGVFEMDAIGDASPSNVLWAGCFAEA